MEDGRGCVVGGATTPKNYSLIFSSADICRTEAEAFEFLLQLREPYSTLCPVYQFYFNYELFEFKFTLVSFPMFFSLHAHYSGLNLFL